MILLHGAKLPLAFVMSVIALVRPARSQSLASDTARVDTTLSARQDSITKSVIPVAIVGSIDQSLPSAMVIDDSARRFMDYESLGDLVSRTPGGFNFSLGSPGQFQGLTLHGLGARNIAILANGTLLNDSYSGTYDPNLYSLEDIGRVEIIPEARSFLYGLNSSGGAINLVSKSRKAVHPYSHVRYSEDGYGYSLLDGMVSQDITRSLNVTAGVVHTTVDGRFANSDGDTWSGGARLRYNLSSEVNLFGSEVYNQTRLDMNGGIDSTTPGYLRFDRIQATVHNTDSYEKVSRHDIQLGIATNFRADSNAVNTLTLYYSRNLREFRDEENRLSPNGIFFQQNQLSRWYGLKFAEHRIVDRVALDLGAEIQSRNILVGPPGNDGSTTLGDERRTTDYSIAGKSDVRLSEALRVSGYGRFESHEDQHEFSVGADGGMRVADWLELFGGASRSYRFPTPQELYGTLPVVSSTITGKAERHEVVDGGLRSSPGRAYSFEFSAFRRTVENPIVVRQLPVPAGTTPFGFDRAASELLRGVDGSASFRFGSFFMEGGAQFVEILIGDNAQDDFPRWSGHGGVWFWDTLIGGHLNLKSGFKGKFFSSFQGREYNQLARIDVPSLSPVTIGASGTVDFLLIAHLGNAYVHFVWENLFDRQYIMRIFYPMPDRNIRFGISWDFLD